MAQLHAELLLNGEVLSIDPSSGSGNSMPGWAWFSRGRLTGFGILQIPPGIMDAPTRLQHIRRVLNDLTKPDILVIEGISPGFGGMMISSSLLHSVGVFISQWSIPVIECSPVTWKSHLDKSLYVKSDQQDAVSIGVATIRVCQRELGLVESEMIYVV